jgi:serine/threonine protein kinase
LAPEILTGNVYGTQVDVWALGILCYKLLNGKFHLPANLHPLKAVFKIPKDPAPRLDAALFSMNARDFVANCLQKDPDARSLAKSLLQHPFITELSQNGQLMSFVNK